MAEEMNKWVKASFLSYIFIAILNFIIVIGKENSASFKDFFINFGGTFGIAHHLYGHIVFLLIIFLILVLLFALVAPVGDGLANAFKMNDYVMAAYYMLGSTALSALVILGFMAKIAFGGE